MIDDRHFGYPRIPNTTLYSYISVDCVYTFFSSNTFLTMLLKSNTDHKVVGCFKTQEG